MREIEFRGKRIDNGEWVCGLPMYRNYIKQFTKHEWIDNLDNNRVKTYQTSADFQIEEKTLGQYTGLKDKNGTKIFEGDIVNMLNITDYPMQIKWNKKWARFILYNFVDKTEMNLFTEQCEVIGNIYDNPELVKE